MSDQPLTLGNLATALAQSQTVNEAITTASAERN